MQLFVFCVKWERKKAATRDKTDKETTDNKTKETTEKATNIVEYIAKCKTQNDKQNKVKTTKQKSP